ncbi:MAG: transcriptional repressor [Candidatus Dojkabacteria bacterium]|nr:MAG: transcriptional repressor [Candidatus Dojkabacteria bacterium]
MTGISKKTRFSPKRQAVMDIFDNGGVYTAPEIAELLPDMDLTTVYRNLKHLITAGYIKELTLSNGVASYESAYENHQHAVCKNCGKVYHLHIDETQLKKLIPDIDFEVENVEIIIKGHCKN